MWVSGGSLCSLLSTRQCCCHWDRESLYASFSFCHFPCFAGVGILLGGKVQYSAVGSVFSVSIYWGGKKDTMCDKLSAYRYQRFFSGFLGISWYFTRLFVVWRMVVVDAFRAIQGCVPVNSNQKQRHAGMLSQGVLEPGDAQSQDQTCRVPWSRCFESVFITVILQHSLLMTKQAFLHPGTLLTCLPTPCTCRCARCTTRSGAASPLPPWRSHTGTPSHHTGVSRGRLTGSHTLL